MFNGGVELDFVVFAAQTASVRETQLWSQKIVG